jgi:hypothetical protein
MELEFSGEIVFWRGPAPWYFVPVPEEQSLDLEEMSSMLSYGWGCIPVTAEIGKTHWYTSLFPKDGRYLVPLKAAVRKSERLELGELVDVRLTTTR